MGDGVFLNKMQDVAELCEKYHTPRFSGFLDEREQTLLLKDGLFGGVLFGGYDDAERRILGVFPDWIEPEEMEFPIQILEFVKKYDTKISHRDYLGTVLSLGIERRKIGDILVGEKSAYMFVMADIADFICDNIRKVSGCGVDIRICKMCEVTLPERQFEIIDTVAASMRADAVLAALIKKSRSEAKSLISSDKVSVNHCVIADVDTAIKEGDLLSVRGFGRAELIRIGNKTGSGRLHVTLRKYI